MSRKQQKFAGNNPFSVEDVIYFCVLDFEATCWKDERSTQQEIIEFPSVLVRMDWSHQVAETIGEFHKYVRPILRPELSQFCTELTGIVQEQVDHGHTLDEVLLFHQEWLQSLVPIEDASKVIFVTCGNWDLKTMLPTEYSNKPDLPQLPESLYHHFLNLKFVFQSCHRSLSARGMTGMLDHLHLSLEGRHHSGIDDTRNIARILLHLLVSDHSLTPAIVARQAQSMCFQT